MFVAWRDLRFARGRFLLIAAVVALITLLVGFLAGLTGGLAAQNVSAVLGLPGERLVLQQTSSGSPSFATSALDASTVAAWENAPGVEHVLPVGIAQARAERDASGRDTSGRDASAAGSAAGGSPTGVALFGFSHDRAAEGRRTELTALAPDADGEVGLSLGAAKALDAGVGDAVTIAGTAYTVANVGGSAEAGAPGSADPWYSHTPVIAMTPGDWAAASQGIGGSGEATVLAVTGADETAAATGAGTQQPDWAAIEERTGSIAQAPLPSLMGLEAFRSEIGSLGLMIAMLFGISALVVGAFFTVWTMQRAGDVAVLKALGASTGSLVRDALGQALAVLALGIGAGLIAVVALGALAGQALPFMLHPLTTLAPAAVMALLGLAGAAIALRPVTSADPLTALGSHR